MLDYQALGVDDIKEVEYRNDLPPSAIFDEPITPNDAPKLAEDLQFITRLQDASNELLVLAESICEAGGMNQTFALEAENLHPGFISSKAPLSLYTKSLSATRYKVAMEGIWESSKKVVSDVWKRLLELLTRFVDWIKGSLKKSNFDRKVKAVEAASQVKTPDEPLASVINDTLKSQQSAKEAIGRLAERFKNDDRALSAQSLESKVLRNTAAARSRFEALLESDVAQDILAAGTWVSSCLNVLANISTINQQIRQELQNLETAANAVANQAAFGPAQEIYTDLKFQAKSASYAGPYDELGQWLRTQRTSIIKSKAENVDAFGALNDLLRFDKQVIGGGGALRGYYREIEELSGLIDGLKDRVKFLNERTQREDHVLAARRHPNNPQGNLTSAELTNEGRTRQALFAHQKFITASVEICNELWLFLNSYVNTVATAATIVGFVGQQIVDLTVQEVIRSGLGYDREKVLTQLGIKASASVWKDSYDKIIGAYEGTAPGAPQPFGDVFKGF